MGSGSVWNKSAASQATLKALETEKNILGNMERTKNLWELEDREKQKQYQNIWESNQANYINPMMQQMFKATNGSATVNKGNPWYQAPKAFDLPGVSAWDAASMPAVNAWDAASMPAINAFDSSSLPAYQNFNASSLPGYKTFNQASLPAYQNFNAASLPGYKTFNPSSLPTTPDSLAANYQYGKGWEDVGEQYGAALEQLSGRNIQNLGNQRQQALAQTMARRGLQGSTADISGQVGFQNWRTNALADAYAQNTGQRLQAEQAAREEYNSTLGLQESSRQADYANKLQQAEYKRQQEQADYAAMLNKAQYGREQQLTDYEKRLQQSQYGRQEEQADYAAMLNKAQYTRDQQLADYAARLQQSQYGRQEEQEDYATQLATSQYTRNQQLADYAARLQQSQYGRQEEQEDYAARLQQAQYGRQEEQEDYAARLQQAQYGREQMVGDEERAREAALQKYGLEMTDEQQRLAQQQWMANYLSSQQGSMLSAGSNIPYAQATPKPVQPDEPSTWETVLGFAGSIAPIIPFL